jgi:transposase
MSVPEALFYVGIDWATETHAVCVLTAAGRINTQFMIEHTAAGFADLLRRLGRLTGNAADVPVGIERPDGRLVDALLDAGFPVVPVSPNAIKTWRDGEVLSGAKSDAGDATVIAEYLRLRVHHLRPATPFSAQTRALRTAVRTRDHVVDMRVAATNQLSALLDMHWPGAKVIFADVESPIALAFLTRFPSYASALRLGEKRLHTFITQNGYSGRRSAAELLVRLRSAPAGVVDAVVSIAAGEAVLAMVGVLTAINAALKALDASVITHLGEHPDAAIFTSLPRSGQINAAQVLAEWGDSRAAYDHPDAIAALAGVSPVTKASGKYRAVHFRWACNKRLRKAITCFADNSRHASPWAANVYAQAIARGHDHPHAVRILARAWIRIIYRCWNAGTPYDATKHGNAVALFQPTAAA